MSARRTPARWNVFTHLSPYRRNNSPGSADIAAKGHGKRIDWDFQETKDGVWAWTHWGRLWIEGFRYTHASVAIARKHGIKGVKAGAVCRRTVKTTPYDLIATLRTRDGYSIGTAHEALELAHAKRITVEVEAKGQPSQAMFDRLATRCHELWGDDWREHVQVKRIWKAGVRNTLSRAKNAAVAGAPDPEPGFITFAIQYRAPRRASALPTYVDFYRR